MPRSTRFLFFVEPIARSSFAIIQTLFLIYAFYVIQIGGAPNPALPPQADPVLQLVRVRWGYVMIALFLCMIVFSFPIGQLIDKVGRRIPLTLSGILMIPAVLLFIFGNYRTVFLAMPLSGYRCFSVFHLRKHCSPIWFHGHNAEKSQVR